MSRLQERIDDYLRMGVRYVWILDPATRRAYAATALLGLQEVKEVLVTESPNIKVPLAEIF
jgi:Uma2 family endonuclease